MTAQKMPDARLCPDCTGIMRLQHRGQFSTVYACDMCASTLTVPPETLPQRSPDRDAPARSTTRSNN
jgi:hypothetical protein